MNNTSHRSQNNGLMIFAALGLLSIGIAIGAGWNAVKTSQTMPSSANEQTIETASEDAKTSPKALYWYDPMYPTQHFDKPGKSPFMDMQLVPKYADAGNNAGTSSNALTVDAAQTQNLGMRLAKVVRIPLQTQLEVSGRLRFNERNLAIVQARAMGFVEKVWPLAVGDTITKGQPIVELVIPEWVSAQYEFLALTTAGEPHLLDVARTRLTLLGMPDTLIQQVEATNKPALRFIITAPIAGVIDSLEVKTGMTLSSGQTLVRINGIESLWLDAAIPEAQSQHSQVGDEAIFYLPKVGLAPIKGKLESLLPTLNENTRTLTARIVLPNVDGQLTPGTTGRVQINSVPSGEGLAIPTEAIIRTGKRTLVMVAETNGKFLPVEITPGSESGELTQILDGLNEGQEVVASGQFLLDSEASLLGITAVKDTAIEQETKMEMQP